MQPSGRDAEHENGKILSQAGQTARRENRPQTHDSALTKQTNLFKQHVQHEREAADAIGAGVRIDRRRRIVICRRRRRAPAVGRAESVAHAQIAGGTDKEAAIDAEGLGLLAAQLDARRQRKRAAAAAATVVRRGEIEAAVRKPADMQK